MLKLRVVCVGKIREKFWLDAQQEYVKRLSRFVRVEIIELKDEKTPDHPTQAERDVVLKREAERIEGSISGFDIVGVLAIEAKPQDSIAFARQMEYYENLGKSICLVIGGSLGLSEALKRRADISFSLSPMTFPHALARIVLLEQLYRAFKISRHENYHK